MYLDNFDALQYSFNNNRIYVRGGYLYVDFFFILQGFFLIKNWDSKEDAYCVTSKYIVGRLKRFFPVVFTAAVLMFIIQVVYCGGVKEISRLCVEITMQITFVSQLFAFVSLGKGGIFWFLSASLIGGTLVIFIYSLMGKKFLILAPLMMAIFYNNIYSICGNTDTWYDLALGGTVKSSIERAVAGIILGIISKYISDQLRKLNFRRWVIIFGKIVTMLMVIATICITIYIPHSVIDFYVLFLFALMLIFADNVYSGKNSMITDFMNELCMPMYIYQVFCMLVVEKCTESRYFFGILVVVLDLVISVIWIKCLSKIQIKKLLILEK